MVVVLLDRPTVGDRHDDAVRESLDEHPVDGELLALVDRGSGLVQKDHAGLLQQHPRKGEALLFTG